MENIQKKQGFLVRLKHQLSGGLERKVIITLFIAAMMDVLVMIVPWYLKYLVTDIYAYMHISQTEFDTLSIVLGVSVIISQIPSGWFADKFSCKKLLMLSTVCSGILAILWSIGCQFGDQLFSESIMIFWYIIYVLFGITATLFFWSPLWKLVASQGPTKQQSKLYGYQGSYNGLLGLFFGGVIGLIVIQLVEVLKESSGNVAIYRLPAIIYVYFIAFLLFLNTFLIGRYVEEVDITKTLKVDAQKQKTSYHTFLKPFLSIRVWLLAFFVLGMYMFQSIFAYYLKELMALAIPAIFVLILANLRTSFFRLFISGPFGNWLKKRSSWILTLAFILLGGILIVFGANLLIGINNSEANIKEIMKQPLFQWLFPILFLLSGIVSWCLVAGRYAQIEEIPHSKKSYGMIVALLSFVGFSSDSWFYFISLSIAKKNPDYVKWYEKDGQTVIDATTKAEASQKVNGAEVIEKYSPQFLQLLIFIALGIALFGFVCGMICFAINYFEKKQTHRPSYRIYQTATSSENLK